MGEDVENIIQNLLHNADYDVEKAARGIVYIDEIDKIARKGDTPVRHPRRRRRGRAAGAAEDHRGHPRQRHSARRQEVQPAGVRPGRHHATSSSSAAAPSTASTAIIKRRVGEKGLGFGAKIAHKDERTVGELLRAGRARGPDEVRDDPRVRRPPAGGRHAQRPASEDDLVTILTQPKNALVKQYQKLFEMEKVKLSFTKEALRAIAREAMRRNSGRPRPARHHGGRDARHHVRRAVPRGRARSARSPRRWSPSTSRRSWCWRRKRRPPRSGRPSPQYAHFP